MDQIFHLLKRNNLTEDEIGLAATLSPLQEKLLENDLAEAIEQKLLLTLDAAVPTSYVQQEAYLRGKIDALTYILTRKEL